MTERVTAKGAQTGWGSPLPAEEVSRAPLEGASGRECPMGIRASLACRGRELRPLPHQRWEQAEAETLIQVHDGRSPVRRGRQGGFQCCQDRGHPHGTRRRRRRRAGRGDTPDAGSGGVAPPGWPGGAGGRSAPGHPARREPGRRGVCVAGAAPTSLRSREESKGAGTPGSVSASSVTPAESFPAITLRPAQPSAPLGSRGRRRQLTRSRVLSLPSVLLPCDTGLSCLMPKHALV